MYHRICVAGTFDQIHTGHEAILLAACEAGEEVMVGLTSDTFIQRYKKNTVVAPFSERKINLEAWLTAHGYSQKARITAIDDPYEPAVSIPDIEVLVVTPNNKSRGEEINEIRKDKGLAPLGLLLVPLIRAEDQQPVSSTRIRGGDIDITGRLLLPDNLRPEMKIPLGHILIGDAIGSSIEMHRGGCIITVGDITTKTMLTAGLTPHLSIIDFQVERKSFPELDEKFSELKIFRVSIASGPGFIAKEAIEVIKKWTLHPEEKILLAISGEEDLLALPAIAYGPVGAVVYYGQPGSGVVEVVVTPEKQNLAIALLNKFSVK